MPFTADITPGQLIPNFRFQIFLGNSTQPAAYVNKVSGLSFTNTPIVFKQGGSQLVENSPGMTTYAAVTLERGLSQDREFAVWANATQSIDHGWPSSSPATLRREVRIVLCDYAMQPAMGWILHDCWCSEYHAIADFDASANAIAIERAKLELVSWENYVVPQGS